MMLNKIRRYLGYEHIYILVLALIFALPMIRSGWITSEGLVLVGVNSTDGLWNLSLIEELKHHFPPQHPGFALQPIRGYHFLYHLLLAVITKVTLIPVRILYFQIFPVLTAYLWGLGVYKVVYEWFKNKSAALFSVFFSFFGGSFAFVWFLFGRSVDIDNVFGMSQPFNSTMVNPAFASSVAIIIWSFYFLLKYEKTKLKRWGVLLAITSGLSVGFKAYAGMILMGAFLVVTLKELILEKDKRLLPYLLLALAISLVVFLPFNAQYGFLVWYAFWPLKRMFHGPLNFTKYDELWDQYEYYKNFYGLFKLYILGLALFIFGNLGTRVVAFVSLWKKIKSGFLSSGTVFYLAMIGVSTVIPMFFIQPIGVFNMIQMYWYFLFLMAVLAGPGVVIISQKITNKFLRWAFYIFIIMLTLPSNLVGINNYLLSSTSVISKDKMELVTYLSDYGSYDSTVMVLPSEETNTVAELDSWFWSSIGDLVIPAFGEKRLYIANEVVQFPYELKDERLDIIAQIMDLKTNSYDLLVQEQIKLIVTKDDVSWLDSWDKTELLFENSSSKVYRLI